MKKSILDLGKILKKADLLEVKGQDDNYGVCKERFGFFCGIPDHICCNYMCVLPTHAACGF